jgi:heme-degrading monooxygenase HmoA
MFHIEADGQAPVIPFDAPAISINQHFIKKGQRGKFGEELGKRKSVLDAAAPVRSDGGWRVEKKTEDEDEFVLFSGLESVEQHQGFRRLEEFEQYKTILKHIESFEVKHAKEFAL